jgi:threonine aldolase
MMNAEVGDDVVDEDPTANRLQAMAADALGMEAALFVPSGTFGNQCAIGVHTSPGDEVIVAETTHVIDHEAGAGAALWGVQMRAVAPINGAYLTPADILPRLRTVEDIHHPRTGLIVLENALAVGTVMPLDAMRAARAVADEHGLPIHLDGARIFNAALALRCEAAEIAALVDSVMFCLSKGLGAPVGSILAGKAGFIAKAKRKRKMMGGGMRQVGVLAAPAIVALTKGVARLEEDHRNARLLAELLAGIPGVVIDPATVQTNMVFCGVDEAAGRTAQGLVDSLNAGGFMVYEPGWWGLRFALSSRVDEGDVRAFAGAVAAYLVGR